MTSKKISLESTYKPMADLEKREEEEYLEDEKSFLDEIKNIFHSFWRAIIWWKIKIW